MAREFLLPDPGEGIHEADIIEVHVSPGDEVKDGDPLFTVETDKAVVDIPSSFDGEIVELRVESGQSVEVGEILLTYTEARDDDEGDTAPDEGDTVPDEKVSDSEGEEEEAQSRTTDEPPLQSGARPVPASPATRSLAKRLDVDLHEIEGSGPDGRIEPEDVQAAAERPETEEPEEEPEEAAPSEDKAEAATDESVEWVELRSVRRATAEQMARSWREIPHVTHHDVADITGLEEFRRTYEDEAGGKLSITAFLLKASAVALAEHPRFNATLDMENQRVGLKQVYNIGVAVDTEDGLIVPVIRDVDRKSIADLAEELSEVAERMRAGDRSMEDLQGGTFTITNPGGMGGTGFTPIINHPEVAILGAAQARQVPVVTNVQPAQDGESRSFDITPRLHLPLILAFDHRVNDGADAARFVNTVKALLEDFPRFLLES